MALASINPQDFKLNRSQLNMDRYSPLFPSFEAEIRFFMLVMSTVWVTFSILVEYDEDVKYEEIVSAGFEQVKSQPEVYGAYRAWYEEKWERWPEVKTCNRPSRLYFMPLMQFPMETAIIWTAIIFYSRLRRIGCHQSASKVFRHIPRFLDIDNILILAFNTISRISNLGLSLKSNFTCKVMKGFRVFIFQGAMYGRLILVVEQFGNIWSRELGAKLAGWFLAGAAADVARISLNAIVTAEVNLIEEIPVCTLDWGSKRHTVVIQDVLGSQSLICIVLTLTIVTVCHILIKLIIPYELNLASGCPVHVVYYDYYIRRVPLERMEGLSGRPSPLLARLIKFTYERRFVSLLGVALFVPEILLNLMADRFEWHRDRRVYLMFEQMFNVLPYFNSALNLYSESKLTPRMAHL